MTLEIRRVHFHQNSEPSQEIASAEAASLSLTVLYSLALFHTLSSSCSASLMRFQFLIFEQSCSLTLLLLFYVSFCGFTSQPSLSHLFFCFLQKGQESVRQSESFESGLEAMTKVLIYSPASYNYSFNM